MTELGSSAAHAALKQAVRLEIGSQPDVRCFENPRGFDERARAFYGMAKGASDLISIVKPRGRWLALEVKTGNAQPTVEQQRFLQMVNDFGGVGRVVRSLDDARAALREART